MRPLFRETLFSYHPPLFLPCSSLVSPSLLSYFSLLPPSFLPLSAAVSPSFLSRFSLLPPLFLPRSSPVPPPFLPRSFSEREREDPTTLGASCPTRQWFGDSQSRLRAARRCMIHERVAGRPPLIGARSERRRALITATAPSGALQRCLSTSHFTRTSKRRPNSPFC